MWRSLSCLVRVLDRDWFYLLAFLAFCRPTGERGVCFLRLSFGVGGTDASLSKKALSIVVRASA